MLEQTPTPSMDLVKLNRRRLDFGVDSNKCDLMPGKQEPPQPQIKQPGAVTSLGSNGAGTTSNLNCNSMLCSSSTSPPQVSSSGGCAWSEARPEVGQGFVGSNFQNYPGGSDASPLWVTEWNNPQQGSTGVFNGYMNQTSLCSSPLTCLVWNPPVTPICHTQPPPSFASGGQPAYCSSCMVFGNVFNISPV